MALLRRGLTGEPVRMLQEKLGVTADGIFGAGTDAALREFQGQNGLEVDGIAGPDTFHAMGLEHLVLLHRPIRGQLVKKLQEGLGIDADGVFGPGTEAAVRKFQEENGLEVDGMAGPNTLALVPGFEITEEVVAQSLVTDATPDVDPAAVEQVRAEEPPPAEEPSTVSKIGTAVFDAADSAGKAYANIGKSIWNTVKKIF